MNTELALTMSEKIDRARQGKTQTWIIQELKQRGFVLNNVQFSRKKKGRNGGGFTDEELAALSEILEVDYLTK